MAMNDKLTNILTDEQCDAQDSEVFLSYDIILLDS